MLRNVYVNLLNAEDTLAPGTVGQKEVCCWEESLFFATLVEGVR